MKDRTMKGSRHFENKLAELLDDMSEDHQVFQPSQTFFSVKGFGNGRESEPRTISDLQ
jgi:hypothetical protein